MGQGDGNGLAVQEQKWEDADLGRAFRFGGSIVGPQISPVEAAGEFHASNGHLRMGQIFPETFAANLGHLLFHETVDQFHGPPFSQDRLFPGIQPQRYFLLFGQLPS